MIENEISKFTNIASKWWDFSGPFKMLHEVNPTRLEYILSQIRKFYDLNSNKEIKKLEILDIGCGGGILSIPLSRLGAKVTAIDAGHENIESLAKKALEENLEISCESCKIEDFITTEKNFDVVICLEVLEHIDNPNEFLSYVSKTVRPGGLVILSTINRTIKSKVFAIFAAERLLKIVPKGLHTYEKLITPAELKRYCNNNNLIITDLTGMVFDLKTRDWKLSGNLDINYFATFKKEN